MSALAALAAAAAIGAGAGHEMRVASFNVRYGTAPDGEHRWDVRKERVVAAIERIGADVVGLQEALAFQASHLRDKLPAFEYFGAGRDDGKEAGEQCGILFRAARFERTGAGHFWLSETPDVAGSRGFDAALPRMATWVRLRDREAGGREVLVVNTHFDHRGARARLESAKLLLERVRALARDGPAVVTGDFNCGEGSEPYAALLGAGLLVDAFRERHPERRPDEGTFHDYGGGRDGARIDWILHTRHFRAVEAEIDARPVDGRPPSDHHPVTALLRGWKRAPRADRRD